MKFLKSLLLLSFVFSLFLSFQGCKESDTDGNSSSLFERGDSAMRTVLVYIMAENNLTDNVASDLNEMKQGLYAMPDSCHLLAFVDNKKMPYICRFYRAEAGVSACDTVYEFNEDFCSTDTVNFKKVLDWVLEEYPSEHLGLVMWSHGTGWLYDANSTRSIGVDNGRNNYDVLSPTSRWMEIDELAAVLEGLPVKRDFVLFDACFMQCVEVAYALRHSAEWLVGSPAELPANGAPYDQIMGAMFSFPFDANELIQQYKLGYPEFSGVTLSAVKCSEIDKLAEVTAAFVPKYFSADSVVDDKKVFAYLQDGYFSSQISYPEYFDMNGQMMLRLPEDAYLSWRSAFDEAVPYRVASRRWLSGINRTNYYVDMVQFGGLSMYVPRNKNTYSLFNRIFRKTEWYHAAAWQMAGW